MYNFEFINNEEIIKIFDEICIKQETNEKTTTIILTNKRLLFLDYLQPNEGLELLRVARGMNYIKCKEVYYQINLDDIDKIIKNEYYQVTLKNNITFEFDNDELYKLIKNN